MNRRTRSVITSFLVRNEWWLPLAIGAVWWCAMYPGLFGEDSLLNLTEARHGPVTVLFTAWWIYVIRLVTLGTRAIPLLTLFGVLALTFAIRQWAAACFPAGVVRALAVCVICATPLVGALGIQVRHDVEMTAGLLLCVAVATRVSAPGVQLRASDYGQLAFATLLIATRHNGAPTILSGAIGAVMFGGTGRARTTLIFMTVGIAALILVQSATRLSGNRSSVDAFGSVEWALTDISCLLSKGDIRVTPEDWAVLTTIASPSDWPQPTSCRFMAKELFAAPSFRRSAVAQNPVGLVREWLALAMKNPLEMIAAHAERVRLFLPPFVTGMPRPDNLPFIHSTILPNDFGLRWKFPRVTGTVRLVVRAWNALALVVANASVWLIALMLSASSMGERGRSLRSTIVVAIALEVGILIAAPMSEGRYGMFILICGQIATLVAVRGLCRRRMQAHAA